MASVSLYPPIVDSYLPAFIVSGNASYCRFYFSLSKVSSSTSPIKSIHISIIKQSSGQSVVKKVDGLNRYRSSGIIILNTAPIPVVGKDNLYYVDILNEDIQSGDALGWQVGWIYKMQLRLSTVEYDGTIGQSAWLNVNANNFSEWSTYCVTKAIGKPRITIPIIKNFDSDVDTTIKDKTFSLDLSTLKIDGTYSNMDISETLYSYRLQLLDNEDNLLEDSGIIYTNEYYTPNEIHYLFKTELENETRYKLSLEYSTINKYEERYEFNLYIDQIPLEEHTINAITLDNAILTEDEDFIKEFNELTTKEVEQEEGRVIIKLYSPNKTQPIMTNICIRRADSRDNFQTWTDIKIINCVNKIVNNLPSIEDYTIESGIWYKYGVQTIDVNGDRTLLRTFKHDPLTLREFEHGFLLGEGGKQLKLKYDNVISSYKYNYSESKTDTIGGTYPFITRNGSTKYRSFPLNGLISYTMDEAELFTSDEELYKYDRVIKKYQDRRLEEHFDIYDYRKEFDFREQVLKFLQDGKPKLFKSSTEGNIIVRLMDVNLAPNQTLHRMIGSFSSNAYEIAEATLENYKKYGFYDEGEYLTDLEDSSLRIGQLDILMPVNGDLIQKIWEAYDHSAQEMAGYKIYIRDVRSLDIEFLDSPLVVVNNIGEEVFGNNFIYNNMNFTVNANSTRIYSFDDSLLFKKSDKIIILGDEAGEVEYVHLLANFIYEEVKVPAEEPKVDSRSLLRNVGQAFGCYAPGDNIYNDIYYKYYYDWNDKFGLLYKLTWSCIEAEPHSVFKITDRGIENTYEVNDTGILNFEDYENNIQSIIYLGIKQNNGEINTSEKGDISLDYTYSMIKGTYKEG